MTDITSKADIIHPQRDNIRKTSYLALPLGSTSGSNQSGTFYFLILNIFNLFLWKLNQKSQLKKKNQKLNTDFNSLASLWAIFLPKKLLIITARLWAVYCTKSLIWAVIRRISSKIHRKWSVYAYIFFFKVRTCLSSTFFRLNVHISLLKVQNKIFSSFVILDIK